MRDNIMKKTMTARFGLRHLSTDVSKISGAREEDLVTHESSAQEHRV